MTERKGGDHRNQGLNPSEWDDQAQQKQHMIDAGQDMLDAKLDETERGFPPSRVEVDAPGPAGDHQDAAGPVERDVAHRQLDGVAKIGADQALDGKYRFG